ncbi:MAG: hypothetical protein AB4372_22585 [Xenococcus sp. (in: cyanobacteria)]
MMKTNQLRLSEQLDNYLEEFRDQANTENYSLEIISAIQRLSEMPKYMEIDIESILREKRKEVQKSHLALLYKILEAFDEIINFISGKKPDINIVARCKADDFITAKKNGIKPLLYEIIKDIQETINLSREESESWRKETVNVNRQLKELEDKYSKLQKDYKTQVFSYMCRDYQRILEQIGSHPSEKTEQIIKRIIEEALQEINVDILWEQPEASNGKYFLTQNDSEATNSGVVRPCLARKSDVLHQGVVLNPINGKE